MREFTVLSMKKFAIALGISLSSFIALPGCSSESEPQQLPEPRCEPRSTTEPSRLTLETSAENYGAMPPCEAIVNFAVTGNSAVRSVAGEVEIIGPAGDVLHSDAIEAALQGPSFGVFQNDVHIDSVDGHICRELELHLELLHCGNEDGNRIECPEVRVKKSFVLERFTAHGAEIDVCFDD